jgi:cyclic pyranopterin monophosphate synthase
MNSWMLGGAMCEHPRVAPASKKKPPTTPLTHIDARGQARMVDVGEKPKTERLAVARARVQMEAATLQLLASGTAKKGDVLAVARVAAIQAVKRTPELIPLCHAIAITGTQVEFTLDDAESCVHIEVHVKAADRTGVEMEALTGASIAALTIYDMLKAVDRGMTIEGLGVYEKRGGKSGAWKRR